MRPSYPIYEGKAMTTKNTLALALEALETIALAGMSGTGQESEEGMTEWHARRAWEFIGIAARAITAIKQAQQAQEPVKITCTTCKHIDAPVHASPCKDCHKGCELNKNWGPAPKQSEHERIKAFLHKHKVSALPDGACKCCEGEGEIGGQFSGGIQECPDCNGSGRAAPKQAEPGWQPIESAPKDGSEILLANPDGSCAVGWFKFKGHTTGWTDGDTFNMTWPTHWMPLPAAPEAL
jgi:hypothetical protein